MSQNADDSEVDMELGPSACEPDWLASSSGLDLVWDSAAEVSLSTDDDCSDSIEHGLELWRNMHSDLSSATTAANEEHSSNVAAEAAAASQAAALRRHNNRVLAEAGVMDGAAPWAVLSPFDVAAVSGAAAEVGPLLLHRYRLTAYIWVAGLHGIKFMPCFGSCEVMSTISKVASHYVRSTLRLR